MKTLVIVNPASGRGRTGKLWPQLQPRVQSALGACEIVLTTQSSAATELARAALLAGMERVISVGGDGTHHEVVQGFFDPETRTRINPDAVLGLLSSGTGGDLGRALGLDPDPGKGLDAQLARIASQQTRVIDVLTCTYDLDGAHGWQVALNAASCGQGGDLVHRIDRWKWLGSGGLPYVAAGIEGAVFVHPWSLELRVDDGPWEPVRARNLSLLNGRFQGGGMEFAPDALLDDGLADLVMLGEIGAFKSVTVGIRSFWQRVDQIPGVSSRKFRKLQVRDAAEQPPMWLELDGERAGCVPATFEVVPQALRLAGN